MTKKKRRAIEESERDLPQEEREARAKKRRRKSLTLKIVACGLALALCGTGLGVGLMFIPKAGLTLDTSYSSVTIEVGKGETYDPSAQYDDKALDIFGRLNWTFQQQDEWYSSYQGYVHTTVPQDVKTVKQFKDGRLISTDISTSSIVNVAREFCYIPSADRVIWREASGGPASYNGFDTPWKKGEPVGNMTIEGPDGFKAKNGLPATELSVYIFREETVLSAEPVKDNGDGTYTVTYHLNPEVRKNEEGVSEGAAAYYCNQMKFTGGLTGVPSFKLIDISFTFNEKWENLKTEAHEEYTATKGFTVPCTADGVTLFSYDTPYLPFCNDYENYFEQYVKMEATGAPDPTLDSMGALSEAFAPVINGPTTLSLDLTIDGKPVEGIIYLDLHTGGAVPSFGSEEEIADFIRKLEVRAKIGDVGLWVEDGTAYVSVSGKWKLKLTVSELWDLVSGLMGTAEGEAVAPEESEEAGDPFSDVLNGEFTHEKGSGKASMHSVLALGDVTIPIDFDYIVDEKTLDVTLGSVKTEFGLGGISLSAALGYTAKSAPAPVEGKDGFVELAQCVKEIADIATADVLHADVSYQNEELGLAVSGGIDIAVKDFALSAALEVTYGGKGKTVTVIYQDGVACLDLDGIRLSADVEEAMGLADAYLGLPEVSLSKDVDLAGLLDKLLFTTVLTDNISIGSTEGEVTAVNFLIKVKELLAAFGADIGFDLGTVSVSVGGGISLEVLGVRIDIEEGAPFKASTDGYPEITPYIADLAALFSQKYVSASVSYHENDITVEGGLDLALQDGTAKGEFTIGYKTATKTVGIAYAGDNIYLSIDGLGLKLNVKEAVDVVKSVLAPETGETPASEESPTLDEVLTKLFGLRLGDYAELKDETNVFTLTLKGTELLTELGVDFKPGDITLTVADGRLEAAALGATVGVRALLLAEDGTFSDGTTPEEKFAIDEDAYNDVTDVLKKLPAILSAKAIGFEGDLSVLVGDTHVALEIPEGYFAWGLGEEGKGFCFYADATLVVGKTRIALQLKLTDTGIKLACAGIGLDLAFDDLGGLETSLLRVYNEIRLIIDDMLEEGSENPLPELNSLKDLFGGLTASAAALGETAEKTEGLDIVALIESLVIGNSEKEGGIAHLGYKPAGAAEELVYADILKGLTEEGLVGIVLGVKTDSVTVLGELHASVRTKDEEPEMLARFITADEIDVFLGYIGSAIDLFKTTDLTLTFGGKVTSTDTETYPAEEGQGVGTKYTVDAHMSTHRGSANLIHLDVNGKNLWVDTDVYAHASIAVAATRPDLDKSIYADLYILDADPDGEADNMLDFYVTLSQYASGTDKYDPVCLYAPSDEILPILSGVVAMLGADAEAINSVLASVLNGAVGTLLNDYMVTKWLGDKEIGQLEALGGLVAPLLGGLLNKDAGAEEAAPAPAALDEEAPALLSIGDYLKGLTVEGNKLEIVLDSAKLYGMEGLDNVVATLTKDADTSTEEGYSYGLFRTLDLKNIYDKAGVLNTTLTGTVTYDTVTPQNPTVKYTSFLGADKLILAIANSATHGVDEQGDIISGEETPHKYVLNNNFYIDGTIGINLHLGDLELIKIDIDIIAISVTIDEDGSLALNLRLEYKGNYSTIAAAAGVFMGIDGNIVNGTSTVDLTLKNGMVYMKRVQTTDSRNRDITPVTLYRAAPASSFTANILDHVQFLFNLGDKLWAYINEQINKSSGGEETPAEEVDFGKRLHDVLSAYTFTPEKTNDDGSLTPASWDLTLNGDAFLKGVLGDINVLLKEDADGFFHDITVNLGMIPVGNSTLIDAGLTLRWRNPGGTMEEGASDKTQSGFVADLESKEHGVGGIVEQLNATNGWSHTLEDGSTEGIKYLEAQEQTVYYKYRTYAGAETDFDTPQQQNVMVSTGQGGLEANTLFSELTYPELPDDGKEFYVAGMEHVEVGEVLRTELFAQQYKHLYTVKFWSEESLGEDWNYDEAESKWWRKFDMEYGAKVTFVAKDAEFHDAYTVIDDNEQEVTLPARPAYAEGQDVASDWTVNFNQKGTEFKVLYKIDTVKYSSPDVAFTVEGNSNLYNEYSAQFTEDTYTLITPSAEGYTFLGWYAKDADGKWSKVETVSKGAEEVVTTEVQALWAADGWITLTSSKSSSWGTEKYNASATVDSAKIVGAWADEFENASVKYAFTFNTNASSADYGAYSETNEATDSRGITKSKYTHAHVKVEVVYTLTDGTQFTVTGERHMQMPSV